MRFNEHDILLYDGSAFFTNVPFVETIQILSNKDFTENWPNVTFNLNVRRDDLFMLLQVVTKDQLLQFHSSLYKQLMAWQWDHHEDSS